MISCWTIWILLVTCLLSISLIVECKPSNIGPSDSSTYINSDSYDKMDSLTGTSGLRPRSHAELNSATPNYTTELQEVYDFRCGFSFEPIFNEKRDPNKTYVAEDFYATLDRYPSFMNILTDVGTPTYIQCGGTLVTREHIITSSNCIPSRHGKVYVDTINFQTKKPRRLTVSKICRLSPDIAILKLSKEVELTPTCQPACIPTEPLQYSFTEATTVGLAPYDTVEDYLNRLHTQPRLQAFPVRRTVCITWPEKPNELHMCLRPIKGLTGFPCKEDLASPTYLTVKGKQSLYSVTSYGYNSTCHSGKAGSSTNANFYLMRRSIINTVKKC